MRIIFRGKGGARILGAILGCVVPEDACRIYFDDIDALPHTDPDEVPKNATQIFLEADGGFSATQSEGSVLFAQRIDMRHLYYRDTVFYSCEETGCEIWRVPHDRDVTNNHLVITIGGEVADPANDTFPANTPPMVVCGYIHRVVGEYDEPRFLEQRISEVKAELEKASRELAELESELEASRKEVASRRARLLKL